jgi:hypothetical protein
MDGRIFAFLFNSNEIIIIYSVETSNFEQSINMKQSYKFWLILYTGSC